MVCELITGFSGVLLVDDETGGLETLEGTELSDEDVCVDELSVEELCVDELMLDEVMLEELFDEELVLEELWVDELE